MRSTARRPATAVAAALALGALAAAPATASETATAGSGSGASARPTASGADDEDSGGAAAGASVTPLGGTVVSSEGVEVTTYGTARVAWDQDTTRAPVFQAVHAVQRVEDVTLVYFSVGYLEGGPPNGFTSQGRASTVNGVDLNSFGSATFVSVVAPAQGLLLYAVPDPEDENGTPKALSSPTSALPSEPGVMNVLVAVLPALPEDVDTVDVTLGHAGVVTDVPVGEGMLEPTVAGPQVPVGSGWPEVPDTWLSAPAVPAFSVRPLSAISEDADGFAREAEAGTQVSIDIAADVLFAFDSADLSPDAVARVQQVATEVAARATPGQLSVVGHTDDNGPDDYNLDLSRRRAESVAAVMRPVLADAGLEIVVDGRGETEPVADNGTEDGAQLNRRVSVGFTETAGQD